MSPRSQSHPLEVTAFAPATVANVAVGFDILGFPFEQVGDHVTVERLDSYKDVIVEKISGVVVDIPKDPAKNTASVALRTMISALKLPFGFRVSIKKGIPLGSGMGGSAASAVGAVVAANALLDQSVANDRLLHFALAGEAAASGDLHADNIAPCLYGGLTLVLSTAPAQIIQIPLPDGIVCVLVKPHIKIETRHARSILKPQILLSEHVRQSAHLGAFIAACFRSDHALIKASLVDSLIEPQRASMIPGFHDAKSAALAQGALGFSISGSGPCVFAWADSFPTAQKVSDAIQVAFKGFGLTSDAWIGPLGKKGARVVE